MASTTDLDDVFNFLSLATELENQNRIEAATKYYEAVYLMKRYIERLPVDSDNKMKIKQLLIEKSAYYEQIASDLMMSSDDSTNTVTMKTGTTTPIISTDHRTVISELTYSPRSPFTVASNNTQRFFPDYDIIPPPIPPPNNNNNNRRTHSGSDRSTVLQSNNNNNSNNNNVVDTMISQANTKLATALDLDESNKAQLAITSYMEAAEIYLKVMQQCSKDSPIIPIIKTRLEQTLDRVEVLKNPNKKAVKQQPRGLLQITEKSTTKSHQSLTKEEIEILKQSSLISSGLFLPWSDDDANKLSNQVKHGGKAKLYTDPDGFLQLSIKQKERFHSWARPTEILQLRRQNAILGSIMKPKNGTPSMIVSITPYTIKQKYVTDCSFIASLCICATYERKFKKRLVTAIVYPQDDNGTPIYNPNGQYMVKLWLNGVARCVTVDDYLPIDRNGNLLCSHTTNNTTSTIELWVSIIEKAYMKLCGGYDFPGSNSGVDLFSLTGWIPERIMFPKDIENIRDFETPAERVWERIFSANSYGDCLITVSTQNELSEQDATDVGLVTGHAYAVLAVIQTSNNVKLLQLKNPWANKGWRGKYSCYDKINWTKQLQKEIGYNPDLAAKQDDGIFWICWDDILHYFQNFHLSWNSSLFYSRVTLHGTWLLKNGPNDDTFNIGENPQYILTLSDNAIKKHATIWVLISRHVSKQEQAGSEANDYLTVHFHRNNVKRDRIWYPGRSGNCVLTGCYTNNPHVLVRYDVENESDKYLSLILSQYKKNKDLNYSLSVYCTEDFVLGRQGFNDLPYHVELSSAWSTYTAGGPIGQDQYVNNPQFSVHIPTTADVQIKLTMTSSTVAGNIILVPVNTYGDSIKKASEKPVIDSGKYRHGFVVSDKKRIKAGFYTLIISNFHVGQTGLFNIKFSHSSPKHVKIEKI